MTPKKFGKYTRKPSQVQPDRVAGIKTGGGHIHRLFGIENHQQLVPFQDDFDITG